MVSDVRARLRQTTRAAALVGITAAMLPPFLVRMRGLAEAERRPIRNRWIRRWARSLLEVFAIDVVVDDPDDAAKTTDRGRLVIANHRSAIDIGVMLSVFGGTMVSRADIATWPVLGNAARAVGTIFVDRSSTKSGVATIRNIQKQLAAGETVVVFPEGTTFDGDVVRPFFQGAFIAALNAGAEIVPVGIAYPRNSGAAYVNETFPEHVARVAKSSGTRMAVAVGAPFVAGANERSRAVTERAQREVQTLVERARGIAGD